MDLLTADRAIEGYRKAGLDAADLARLELFRGIWEIWDEEGRTGVPEGSSAYPVPDAIDLKAWYLASEPFLRHAPASLGAGDVARVAGRIASYLADRGGFSEAEARCLVSVDWEALAVAAGAELAGSDPDAFLTRAGELARGEDEGEQDGVSGATAGALALESVSSLVPLVLSLALRPLLEPVQRACMGVMAPVLTAAYDELPRPLSCPVCGGAAALGYVGPTPGSSGNGRELYCAQCGCVWEVERVRCARCGTRSQTRLRYLSLAGDELHRVHVCDECGGYLRTYFAGGLDAPLARGLAGLPSLALAAPFSPEVEDVVMAPLDAVAREALAGEGAVQRADIAS